MAKKTISKSPVGLCILTISYVAVLAILTLLNCFGAERIWIGALNLYLPQIVWLIPGLSLFCYYLKVAWRLAWVPCICLGWVLGPIMGFCWPWHKITETPRSGQLRVMTWNVKWGGDSELNKLLFVYEIDWRRPDVVLLQDSGDALDGPLGDFFKNWNVRCFGQYIIASQLPLSEASVQWISFAGERHTCLRCELQLKTTRVALYNIHFQTPRFGLNALRSVRSKPWYLPRAIAEFEDNVDERLTQAHTLSELIKREKGPVIIAGDFNSPDGSLTCKMLRDAGLSDAYANAGKGYGYTYGHALLRNRIPWLRISFMRIDHVMYSSQIEAIACQTGMKDASEHRPVIADLVLK